MAKEIQIKSTLFGEEEVIVTTKTIPSVDEQWKIWQKENIDSLTKNIEDEYVKQSLIDDLTYVSNMDVREYTLYQKWCEIKERYPVHETSQLWGTDIEMVDCKHREIIEEVKKNFWVPKEPDDFESPAE